MSDIFRTLADANRRRLLDHLRQQPCSVNQLHQQLTISQPAVSQHLQILREAGLVKQTKIGRTHWYQLNSQPLKEVAAWLSNYETFWDQRIDQLDQFLSNQHQDED